MERKNTRLRDLCDSNEAMSEQIILNINKKKLFHGLCANSHPHIPYHVLGRRPGELTPPLSDQLLPVTQQR